MPGRAGRNKRNEPYHYWNNIARNQAEAQALAARIGLNFPASGQPEFKGGLAYPIRRLITTGEDTPESYAHFLGPGWETESTKSIKQIRLDVLLCPPPGSPNQILSEALDEGSPRWTPRAPTQEEQEEITKVRDMNSKVTEQIGNKKDIGTGDIKDILMSMGGNWASNLPALQAALNSRDQNVQGRGRP